MQGVQTPVFIRLGNRNEKMDNEVTGPSILRNVIISNITSDQLSRRTSSITGIPGNYVENIKLSNIIINIYSDGTEEDAKAGVAEKENSYPSPHSFGPALPAYGFYIRHVKNITLSGIQLNMLGQDKRRPVVMDDVRYAHFSAFQLSSIDGNTRTLTAHDVDSANSSDLGIGGQGPR
jgi:hypothetical protein